MIVWAVLLEHATIAIFKNIVSGNAQMILFVKPTQKQSSIHHLVHGHVFPKVVLVVIPQNVLIKALDVRGECVWPQ